MVTMNLSKLLKHKNRVVERLTKLDALLAVNNSVICGNSRDKDPRHLLGERKVIVDHLVDVKAALATSNAPIYRRILRISELKGLIKVLNSLDTKHGKQVVGYSDTQTEYEAVWRQSEIDKMVKDLQSEIDSNQDEIDKFNYNTEVVVSNVPDGV
jgi:hypothetical protein